MYYIAYVTALLLAQMFSQPELAVLADWLGARGLTTLAYTVWMRSDGPYEVMWNEYVKEHGSVPLVF